MPRTRVCYIKRGTIGDGCCVDECLDIDELPRLGDCVFLNERMSKIIGDFDPEGMSIPGGIPDRRYIVTRVEHKWDRLSAPIYNVTISTLTKEETIT